MYAGKKIIVVLPAYNAASTLERTVADLPEITDEIILVDDKSHDETVAVAKRLGLTVFEHEQNKGYGGNQKTCYRLALEHGADIVVMVHPDYQYDPRLVSYFASFIADDHFDVMLGSRIRTRQEALRGGMPRYKYYSNRFLTLIENLATGRNLSEWHTGMRAYSRVVLESLDINKMSDDFVFDSQALLQICARKWRIGEIPVPVRYFPEASSINWKRSLRYGFSTLGLALAYFFGHRP
ncbi:glycosyl transferase family 2 [Candidatus Falkowbacteria bacterium HGW-Falkowbacteria-2]|uniref:Glycosyl transferase family 2 n=1 Tax=Candidatus Falkowbacteria bacterium HGW-Falkowbacteria-2 TaxID=2013769 RepID=A0A2N2E030_9BACT|nr:MAG: glycosyl transferase family 2 [Candidatus Falkowbacteria bacterium HGW-Falkowbacteria-2]